MPIDDTVVLATAWINQPQLERRPARTLLVGAAMLTVRHRFSGWGFELQSHSTTSFEVLSKPGDVRVTVASGVVRFGKNSWFSKPISLSASQAASLDEAGLTRIADVPANDVARWRGVWAEYRGAPLRQVVTDLQTLSPFSIEIADEGLAEKLVGGRIRLTDPAGQLQNLSIIYGFRVRRIDTALVISRN